MKNLRHAFGLTITDVSENHEKHRCQYRWGRVTKRGGAALR